MKVSVEFELKDEFTKNVKAADAATGAFASQIAELRDEFTKARKSTGALAGKMDGLASEVETSKQATSKLTTELEQSREVIGGLSRHVGALGSELAESRGATAALAAAIEKMGGKAEEAKAPLSAIAQRIKALKEGASNAFALGANLGHAADNLERLASQARTALTVPIRAAADYEHALVGLRAKSGASAEEMAKLAELSMSLSQTSPTMALDAMTAMATDGAKASDILENFNTVLDLATASDAPEQFAEVSDKLGNLAQAFGLQDLARAGDVMTTTFSNSATNFFELSEAMVQAGPAAVATGQSFEFTNAALAALAGGGMKGAMAGTALRQALVKLVPQSKRAQEALKGMGVDVFDDAGNFRQGVDILEQLSGSMAGLNEGEQVALIKDVFGEEAFAGISVLLKAAQSGEIREMMDSYEDAAGATKTMAETMRSDTVGSMRELEAEFEKLKIELGTEMLPVVIDLMKELRPMVQGLREWAEENPGLLKGLVEMAIKTTALATVVAPMVRIFGVTATAVGGLKTALAGAAGLQSTLGATSLLAGNAATALSGKAGLARALGSAGLVAAVGLATYGITKLIMEFFGLDKAITNLVDGITKDFVNSNAREYAGAPLPGANKNERGLGRHQQYADGSVWEGNELVRLGREGIGGASPRLLRDAQAAGHTSVEAINAFGAKRREQQAAAATAPAQQQGGEVEVTVRVETGAGTTARVTRTRAAGQANVGEVAVGGF